MDPGDVPFPSSRLFSRCAQGQRLADLSKRQGLHHIVFSGLVVMVLKAKPVRDSKSEMQFHGGKNEKNKIHAAVQKKNHCQSQNTA